MNTELIKRFFLERNVFSKKLDFSTYMLLETSENQINQTNGPIYAGIRLTNKCNLTCGHCFVDRQESKFMKYDEFVEIANKLHKIKLLKLTLTGGEPLCHPDIIKILKYAKRKFEIITLQTNGILFSKLIIREIANIFTSSDIVQISLDGFDNDSLFATRGYRDFDIIEDNIILLKKAGIRVKINVVVTNLNVKILQLLQQKFSFVEVDEVQYSPLFGGVDRKCAIHMPMDNEVLESFSKVLEHYYSCESGRTVITIDPIAVPWGNEELKKLNIDFGKFMCPAQQVSCEIDVNGDVYPCPFLFKEIYKLGNLHTENMEFIWNSENETLYEKYKIVSNDICESCSELSKCKRGCFAIAVDSNESYDTRCELQQKCK